MNENKVISEKELLDAIKSLLKKSGHLNKFQAEVGNVLNQLRYIWQKIIAFARYFCEFKCILCLFNQTSFKQPRNIILIFFMINK